MKSTSAHKDIDTKASPPGAKNSDTKEGASKQIEITSSAVGGAVIGGVVGGSLFGPLGAAAGLALGSVAGEVFDRHAPKDDTAGQNYC